MEGLSTLVIGNLLEGRYYIYVELGRLSVCPHMEQEMIYKQGWSDCMIYTPGFSFWSVGISKAW